MASGQTSNLALNQWAAGDRVTRADFNGDNQKLDAAVGALRAADTTMQGSISALQGSVSALQTAVAGKCSVIVGTYTGDGTAERTISLGVTPKAVLVYAASGYTQSSTITYSGLAVTGSPAAHSPSPTLVKIVGGGFAVYWGNGAATNANNLVFNYIALY